MADDDTKGTGKGGELDRRSVLAGSAATAATAALPQTATAQSGGEIHITAATYMDTGYLNRFNLKKYAPGDEGIGKVYKLVHNKFKTRDDLKWGYYQQDVEPNWINWGSTLAKARKAYDGWLDFMEDARDDLEKQPAKFHEAKNCINPFDTTVVAGNLVDHLDEVIRIALWDHSDIPLKLDVNKRTRRHHALTTEWDVDWVNKKLKGLTIHINCPDGGWQGYTWWPDRAPGAHITKMQARWQVPQHPRKSGKQIIFIFDGLESRSKKDVPGGVLQPVLQWADGIWSVRSWYVQADFTPPDPLTLPDLDDELGQDQLDSKKFCYSKAVKGLKPGQTITGTIVRSKDSDGKIKYTCSLDVDGVPKGETKLEVKDIPELVLPVCAVESYLVRPDHKDEDYPAGPVTMTSIGVEIDGYPLTSIQWKKNRRRGHDYIADATTDGAQIVFTRV